MELSKHEEEEAIVDERLRQGFIRISVESMNGLRSQNDDLEFYVNDDGTLSARIGGVAA